MPELRSGRMPGRGAHAPGRVALPGVLLGLALLLAGCGQNASIGTTNLASAAAASSATAPSVRQPAVAGLFYPKDPQVLAATVDRCLALASTQAVAGVRALIVPHAGYEYSGPIAAAAYRQIAGKPFDAVIILAASHYALFDGLSVPAAAAYATPLGQVPVFAKARALATHAPFVLEPRCMVRRPPWADAASKPAPPVGEDTPETWEHSVEVQLPFLQRTLKTFAILPVVFGRAEPAAVAEALAPLVTERTLVIASSDLSHYQPYADARVLDRETVKWICATNVAGLQAPAAEDRACGRMPILTLMHLAQRKGWTPQVLDARNSGDTAGDKARVVGYAAVVFTAGAGATASAAPAAAPATVLPRPAALNPAERTFLLDLARRTLLSVTVGRGLPEIVPDAVPGRCRATNACFVTLTQSGNLRGCIGNLLPTGPLYQAVVENAARAALNDPRFPPVRAAEAAGLHIEVSVLTVPAPLAFASPEDLVAKLQPHQDGVVLNISGRSATFLPQVWEQLPEKTTFLSHLAAKAGCAADAWRGPDVAVSIYAVEAFAEPK